MSRRFRICTIVISILLASVLLACDNSSAGKLEDTVEKVSVCGVDEKPVSRLLAAVLDSRISRDDAVSVLGILLDVCRHDLPEKPFTDRLDEGLGKRVPGPLVLRALSNMHSDFRAVKAAVSGFDDKETQQVVLAAGMAVTQGVPLEFVLDCIRDYQEQAGRNLLITVFNAARGLAKIGVAPKFVEMIVLAGIDSGSMDRSWQHVARVVAEARDRNISDADVTASAVDVLKDNGSLADLMVSVGFTERDMGHSK